jgi:hypothetical protein
MPESTPDDLAVAFRSLARRQRDALGDADPRAFSDLTAELQRHIVAAAAAVGSAPDADAVAAAIGARRAWDDATLATLREEALAAGGVLRRLAAAEAEQDEQDER